MNRNIFMRLSVLFCIVLFTITKGYSIPAIPDPITLTQPDGSTITVLVKGDEKGFCVTTLDGIPVIRNHQDILE